MKPLALMRYLMKFEITGSGLVVDLCMGNSAICGKAALSEGRTFIGVEYDQKRFEEAEATMAAFTAASSTNSDDGDSADGDSDDGDSADGDSVDDSSTDAVEMADGSTSAPSTSPSPTSEAQVVITVQAAEEGRLLSKFLPAAFSRAAGSIHGLGTVRAEQVPVV